MNHLNLPFRLRPAASRAVALLIALSAGDLAAQTPGAFTHGGATFGIVRDGATSAITKSGAWRWKDGAWGRDDALMAGLEAASADGRQLRDFDHDGLCELLANHDIFVWNEKSLRWQPASYALPPDCAVLDAQKRDNGLRFAELNGDGFDDVIQSNEAGYAIYLWAGTVKANLGWSHGWPHLVAKGPASSDLARAKVLPFVKGGCDTGAQFQRDSIAWKNEAGGQTVSRTFKDIIAFDMPVPKSPADSPKAMRARPGFVVELVASEPLIRSPSVFDWDAQGRLWVVEMPDYPLGMDGKGKPGGAIKILADTDGDGRYDKVQTFLEDLPFRTGIMPWRNGVITASSPNIIFAADNDGDGRADERRVIFTGFKEGNQQHRLNGFDWGLDGWLYGANGDSGGVVNGVSISGRDFRFRPDSGEFEPESGQTQYRRMRDDRGNWFGNNNTAWIWHYSSADSYLRRNPRLAVKTTKKMLANIMPDYPIRLTGYGERKTESAGVAQRLFAKALAFGGDEDGPAVLVTVDNCGVPAAVRDEVVRRLTAKTKVVSDRFALCSTHSHSAPMPVGVLPNIFRADIPAEQQATAERYTRELTDKIEQAALAALADRQPARLAWGVGRVGFAANRRLTKDGKWVGMGDNLSAPADHDLPVLRVTGADGKVRAIFSSYACHRTTLTGIFNQMHGDWAGCAQEALEREFPGAVTLVAQGCGADANLSPRGELATAVQHGETLAAEAKRLVTGTLQPLAGALECRAKRIELAFDTPRTRAEWERLAQNKSARVSYHASKNLARLDRGETLATKLPYFVQTWTFGADLAMVFLAGEVVVDYSLRLKREFGVRLWVNSYANDVPCYIPSRRILEEGGYEAEGSMANYDRPAKLAPEVEERIIGTVHELMPAIITKPANRQAKFEIIRHTRVMTHRLPFFHLSFCGR